MLKFNITTRFFCVVHLWAPGIHSYSESIYQWQNVRNFGPIFEQNAIINFKHIFEKSVNFGPIFEKIANFGPIIKKV